MINKYGRKANVIALVVVLIFLFALPLLLKNPYLLHLVIMCYINIVLGMTFSMLFSCGMITLGAAAFFSVGAYASALLVTRFDLSFWLALPSATIVTAIVALGLGAIIVRHVGMPFVIITLVFGMVVVQFTGQFDVLGGWGGITDIPRPNSIGPIQFTSKKSYYYLVLSLSLLVALAFWALYTSRFGKVWKSIKLSPELAESLGIHLYRYRLLAFIIGSSAAGALGSFYAHYIQSVTPDAFGGWTSIYIQLYAVLGGLEYYILGPAVGSLVMTFVPEFLRVTEEAEPIITGFFLLIIILFFPGGILGTFQQFMRIGWTGLISRISEIKAWVKGNPDDMGGT